MTARDVMKKLTPLMERPEDNRPPFISDEDEHGPYLACLLGNTPHSLMFGWYIFVPPTIGPLMEAFNWAGHVRTHNVAICRHEKSACGKTVFHQLSRAIWTEQNGPIPEGRKVYNARHPLDFRELSLFSPRTKKPGCRGVTFNKGRGIMRWQVKIWVPLTNTYRYIGLADSFEEGLIMYNKHLADLKQRFPEDARIQAMPSNVLPQADAAE